MPIVWEIVEVYTLPNNGIEHARKLAAELGKVR
jgi:hypothetical protein